MNEQTCWTCRCTAQAHTNTHSLSERGDSNFSWSERREDRCHCGVCPSVMDYQFVHWLSVFLEWVYERKLPHQNRDVAQTRHGTAG